jgi:hypothetical protein
MVSTSTVAATPVVLARRVARVGDATHQAPSSPERREHTLLPHDGKNYFERTVALAPQVVRRPTRARACAATKVPRLKKFLILRVREE